MRPSQNQSRKQKNIIDYGSAFPESPQRLVALLKLPADLGDGARGCPQQSAWLRSWALGAGREYLYGIPQPSPQVAQLQQAKLE